MSKVLRFEPGSQMMERPVTTIPLPKSTSSVQTPTSASLLEQDVVLPGGPSADELLEQARLEAERILAKAREEAEGLHISARNAGYEEGRAEAEMLLRGMRAAFEQERAAWNVTREQQQGALESLAQEIADHREHLLAELVRPLPKLCMEIVRELLHRELELAPPDIEAMVSEMLKFILESTRVEIRVSPKDYPAATAAHPTWKNAKYGEWELVIVPDASIEAGGCEIRSDVGRLDGTLAVKLEMVQQMLNTTSLGGDERGDTDS